MRIERRNSLQSHSDTPFGFLEMVQFNFIVKNYLHRTQLCWHPVCLITYMQAVKPLVRNTREKVKTSSWVSKSIKITAALALAAVAIGFVDSAKAVSFSYSNTVGSNIHFPGNHTFSFTPSTNSFHVTSGSAAGALGDHWDFHYWNNHSPFSRLFYRPSYRNGNIRHSRRIR